MAIEKRWARDVWATVWLTGILCLAGCGTPGTPQPPSLKLPELVTDLTAVRAGGSVTLHWTMPKKTTDHLLIATQSHGAVPVEVCVRQTPAGACALAGETELAPAIEAEYRVPLAGALAEGNPRKLLFFVELKNRAGATGRSAGLSNPAVVLGGAAPAAIVDLNAQVRADGVAFHWAQGEATAVRLHRKLLTPPAPKEKKSHSGMMSAPEEPLLRDLLVEPPQAGEKNGALDSTARFGEVYEYTAQRVAQIPVDGKTLELAGDTSAPVRVEVVDTFPPGIPQGLVAVFVAEGKSIDLSWQPDSDADLGGYIVYRINSGAAGSGSEDWTRISGPQPLVGPAYRDTSAAAGQHYRYAVTAIDLTGHESKRSPEAEETVPE